MKKAVQKPVWAPNIRVLASRRAIVRCELQKQLTKPTCFQPVRIREFLGLLDQYELMYPDSLDTGLLHFHGRAIVWLGRPYCDARVLVEPLEFKWTPSWKRFEKELRSVS